MCGIAGIYSLKHTPIPDAWIGNALTQLNKRGPDNTAFYNIGSALLGHARLSIIDTSASANQPFTEETERYTIIFNGEIFNFQSLRKDLESKGYHFKTSGDTEVLLKLFMHYGKDCQNMLNGFWAFAIYNHITKDIFISKDRYGIKPLYFAIENDHCFFASEMKAMFQFPFDKQIDREALSTYFQLNYIPGPLSIVKQIKKLLPGHYMEIKNGIVETHQYYKIPYDYQKIKANNEPYEQQKKRFLETFEDAVRLRLIADVPLGAFLSGGIDSSAVVSMATKHTPNLDTFSIGFAEQAFFDETEYAHLVAKKFNTNHTVFKLKNDDIYGSLHEILDYIDEPFADSSALLVNILSKYTRKKVTVALSGDAGDELFAGYNKHYGEWRTRNAGIVENTVSMLQPVWKSMPKSRHGKVGNIIRQLERFAIGMKLSPEERYWRWCSFLDEQQVKTLIHSNYHPNDKAVKAVKDSFLKYFTPNGDINDFLLADMNLVLPYDMLTKVDMMSMRNSLEVRVPFLDYRVVEFAFSIPESSKIDKSLKKKIVQDAFRDILPAELYNRPKKGFEVPLLQWFRTDLSAMINDKFLNDEIIKEEGILNVEATKELKRRLYSNNPGDVHAQIWAVIVFQHWYSQYKSFLKP